MGATRAGDGMGKKCPPPRPVATLPWFEPMMDDPFPPAGVAGLSAPRGVLLRDRRAWRDAMSATLRRAGLSGSRARPEDDLRVSCTALRMTWPTSAKD
jgi:hypothetical protein